MKGLQLRMLLVAWSVAMVTAAPPLSTATFPVEDGPEDGPGCSKEQYKQRFGALPTYSLTTATTRPAIQSGFVVAKVSYDSLCPGGGSSFTASIKKQANMEIVIMSRSEPECAPAKRLSATFKHSEVVSVPLPAEVGTQKKFLAFPPDGEYELWLLAETEQAGPDFLGGSATHSLPFDASAILRAQPSPATSFVT